MKKIFICAMFLLNSCLLFSSTDSWDSVMPGGHKRGFKLHVPASYNASSSVPLVIALHGGGGSARSMEKLTGFSELSDTQGFIVVYPEAYERLWNDGRSMLQERGERLNVNDVGFISAMIKKIRGIYNIEGGRIYAVGISNGGFMSQRLACELSGTFAAVASVCATMPQNLINTCSPENKISVMIINGTADPIVPYDGGVVKVGNKIRGDISSTTDTVKKWVKLNKVKLISTQTEIKKMKVKTDTYGQKTGSFPEVMLCAIYGGGHAWPGSARNLPEKIAGKTCADFSATEAIWEFFKANKKP